MNLLEYFLTKASKISARGLDWTIKAVASNEKVYNFVKKQDTKRLSQLDSLKRILVVGDINIGDAINIQSFLSPLKNSFPEVEISYAYQYKAYPLIKENPVIKNHFPIFRTIGFPTKIDYRNLKKLIKKHKFDLIINLCPFFSPKDLMSKENSPVITPLRLIRNIIRAYASDTHKAHVTFQLNRFAQELVENFPPGSNPKKISRQPFSGNYLYTNQQLFRKTRSIMKKLGINIHANKIFFNPDTSSLYTQIPFQFQLELLKGILSSKKLDLLLLNSGFTFKGIEKKLINKIPSHLRSKIVVISRDIPIDIYAGLIDNSEMFISGDTGPLHIAAAKKIIVNSDGKFRNSTAVVGIFGATSPRIYGYDSYSEKYLSGTQDAPSKVYEGKPPCKNITCIHKLSKRCPEVRCFDGLEPEQVIDYVGNYLSNY